MKKNVASQVIGAQMIAISDGSVFTGTVSVDVTVDGGTQASGGGSVTHEGGGFHTYAPTTAETNGDHIGFTFSGTGAISNTIQVYTFFPQTVDNAAGIADIPTVSEFDARTLLATEYFDPVADTVANVDLVGICTSNTDMRGTNSANTVAPDNATIVATKADTAAIKAKTDSLTFTSGTALDSNVRKVNSTTVTGNGSLGTEWGPV
jgi:hypothetical protein